MFRALIAAIAFASASLAPPTVRPAAAQSMEATESAMRNFAIWAQEVNGINAELSALYQSSDVLNDLVDAFDEGRADQATALIGIEDWRRHFYDSIAALRQRHDAIVLPYIPAGLEPLDTALQTTQRRMNQFFDESPAFAEMMIDLTRRSINGDVDGAAGAVQRAYLLVRQLIEFENGSYAIRRASAPEGHPNRPLADANIALNNATLIVFEALAEPKDDLFSADQRASLRTAADEVRRHVVAGRAAQAQTRAQASSALYAFTPEMRVGIIRVLDSLTGTFDTLHGAAAFLDEIGATRASDDRSGQLLAFLTRFDEISLEIAAQNSARANMLPTQAPTL